MTNELAARRARKAQNSMLIHRITGMASTPPDEAEAYAAGRKAFADGLKREDCPYPAPIRPARSPEDEAVGPGCLGAFWLDGYEQARDGIGPPSCIPPASE